MDAEADTVMLDAPASSQTAAKPASNGSGLPPSLLKATAAIDLTPAGDSTDEPPVAQTTTDNKPPASNKPKSSVSTVAPNGTAAPKKKPKSPTPPPPPPPPLRTVRLDITLGGPDNYAVDIAVMAKTTGQRNPTPPRPRDISDSEGDDDDPKGAKKAKPGAEPYYDLDDPFIDDSELAVDERKYFAQTKQSGFYVSSGEVALLKDKSPKKPKSTTGKAKRPPLSSSGIPNGITIANQLLAAAAQKSQQGSMSPSQSRRPSLDVNTGSVGGTKDSPIALLDEDEDSHQTGRAPSATRSSGTGNTAATPGSLHDILNHDSTGVGGVGGDRKRKLDGDPDARAGGGSDSGAAGNAMKKKRKVTEILPFHPELEEALAQLRKVVETESFEQKGKFPPSLKPALCQVALKAISLGEYDDNFFNVMPKIFPYNRYTMFKLIKRTVFNDHNALIATRQDQLLAELKTMADEGFEKARDDYYKALAAWEEKQEKKRALSAATVHIGGEEMDVDQQHPASQVLAGEEDGSTAITPATGKDAPKVDHPPVKRYRFTEAMKAHIWSLVTLSNESCALQNEKFMLEGSTETVSDQGMRKTLYQRIQPLFPEGWMTTQSISREVSVMKKKHEKEAAKQEDVEMDG